MNCIYCDTKQPDKGYFCPNCFKQTKCKHCGETLIKDAKICVFCGELLGKTDISTNMNIIEFSETETKRSFKASFTDTVGQSISDSFGIILTNKISSKKNITPALSFANNNPVEEKTEDADSDIIVESPKVIVPELEQLRNIFKEDGDNISLLETRLKANSKRDYGKRLTLLFLYYKHLSGIDNVPRNSLTVILEDASVEDGNLRSWLVNNPLIGNNSGFVHIKASGKDAAKLYLTEMQNSEIKDKWQIGTTSKFGRKPKDKKEKTKQ